MVIIAGERKGTQLYAPNGMDTRPTQAKVKESLFNVIQAWVPEAHVLDLFGGSGNLAFEALSRGAADACLSDFDRSACASIRRNAEKLRYTDRIRLYACDWHTALNQMQSSGAKFDLVFLDPPYKMTDLKEICEMLAEKNLLSQDAMLVLEHRSGAAVLPQEGFECYREKKYGDTEIHFFLYGHSDEQTAGENDA